MVKSGKPGPTTRKVWLAQSGLHPGKPWFNQAFDARVYLISMYTEKDDNLRLSLAILLKGWTVSLFAILY